MADETKPKIRTYKVLRPEPPSAADFEAGDRFVKYAGLGEYRAEDPDEATEQAADEFPDLDGGRFVVIAVTGWQERDAESQTIRRWKVTRPERAGTGEEIDDEQAEQIGEGDPPTAELGEDPTVEQPLSDEDAAAAEQAELDEVERAAMEAAEAEGD